MAFPAAGGHASIIGSLSEWRDNKVNILALNNSDSGPKLYIHQSGSAIGWRTALTSFPFAERNYVLIEGQHRVLLAFANYPKRWPASEEQYDEFEIEDTVPEGFNLRNIHKHPLHSNLINSFWLAEGQSTELHISIGEDREDPVEAPKIQLKNGAIIRTGTFPRPIQFKYEFVRLLNELGNQILASKTKDDAKISLRKISHALLKNLGGFSYLVANQTSPRAVVINYYHDLKAGSSDEFGIWFVNKSATCEKLLAVLK